MFDLYDANKDGYIDAADYARVGEGVGRPTSLSEEPPLGLAVQRYGYALVMASASARRSSNI